MREATIFFVVASRSSLLSPLSSFLFPPSSFLFPPSSFLSPLLYNNFLGEDISVLFNSDKINAAFEFKVGIA